MLPGYGCKLALNRFRKAEAERFVEAFNGRLRPHVNMHCQAVDECLNEHIFGNLAEARRSIEKLRIDYNTVRPDISRGWVGSGRLRQPCHRGLLCVSSARNLREPGPD